MQLMQLTNFIAGERVDPADGRSTEIVDPATGEVFATAPNSGEADVDAAFRAAERAFEDGWGTTTPSER